MNHSYGTGQTEHDERVTKDSVISSSFASPHLDAFDYTALVLILTFGLLQFFLYLRAKDFLYDDVYYFEAARSLLQQGYYGFNGRPEANQPPGVSGILALLCIARHCSYPAFLRAMTVFETLGFVAAYAFLRRSLPSVVAATICFVLVSSDVYFSQATQRVSNGFPYLCFTMIALLVARELENRRGRYAELVGKALLAALFAASLMVASAAMALLGSVVASVGVGFLKNQALARRRIKVWLPALLVGLVVQGIWMHRKAPPLEWPLPGYPGSYLSQLKVKSGQYPELGMATLSDIPERVAGNGLQHLTILAETVFRHWIDPSWRSVFILGPAILILMGLTSAIWASGGNLEEWYFLGYEFIYLLWPWTQDPRFVLPILPLSCLYLWMGGKAFVSLAKKSRLFSVVWTPISLILAFSIWPRMGGFGATGQAPQVSWQLRLSFVLWVASALTALWMALVGRSRLVSGLRHLSVHLLPPNRPRALQTAALIGVAGLIGTGLFADLGVARSNLDPNFFLNRPNPDVLAAQWINAHTDSNAVVMARHVPITYYYSHRHIVWFPPTTNPGLLMGGIKNHRIDYVMVIRRGLDYYLPNDSVCFAALYAAYPHEFHLAYQTSQIEVFRVTPCAISERGARGCSVN